MLVVVMVKKEEEEEEEEEEMEISEGGGSLEGKWIAGTTTSRVSGGEIGRRGNGLRSIGGRTTKGDS